MKTFVSLLLLVVTVNGAKNGGLRVTWGYGSNIGSDYFYDIPKTIDEIVTQGWVSVKQPDGLHYPSLDMYCSDDRVFCVFFDSTNYVVGLQVAIAEDDVENAILDWNYMGYTSWETEVDGVPTKFYTIQQYFVSEENMGRNVDDRLRSWDTNKTIQEDAIWVVATNGELLKIPTVTEEIAKSDFTEQGCMTTMGLHYYYKMKAETDCQTELVSWFPLVDSGDLIATGYAGHYTLKRNPKWFEISPRSIVESNFPNGPNCLYEMVDYPGVVTMHIFYIEEPWLLTCPDK